MERVERKAERFGTAERKTERLPLEMQVRMSVRGIEVPPVAVHDAALFKPPFPRGALLSVEVLLFQFVDINQSGGDLLCLRIRLVTILENASPWCDQGPDPRDRAKSSTTAGNVSQ